MRLEEEWASKVWSELLMIQESRDQPLVVGSLLTSYRLGRPLRTVKQSLIPTPTRSGQPLARMPADVHSRFSTKVSTRQPASFPPPHHLVLASPLPTTYYFISNTVNYVLFHWKIVCIKNKTGSLEENICQAWWRMPLSRLVGMHTHGGSEARLVCTRSSNKNEPSKHVSSLK